MQAVHRRQGFQWNDRCVTAGDHVVGWDSVKLGLDGCDKRIHHWTVGELVQCRPLLYSASTVRSNTVDLRDELGQTILCTLDLKAGPPANGLGVAGLGEYPRFLEQEYVYRESTKLNRLAQMHSHS